MNIPFYFGRKDASVCPIATDRLPDAGTGLSELERVFVKQMGLSIAEATVLLGAHTVGHVHPQFSGYGSVDDIQFLSANYADNAWDETPAVFDNQYYKSLLFEVSQSFHKCFWHHRLADIFSVLFIVVAE